MKQIQSDNSFRSWPPLAAMVMICFLLAPLPASVAWAQERAGNSSSAASQKKDELDYFSKYLMENARSAMQRKRYDQAEDFVKRALENHPDNSSLILTMADIQEHLEQWEEAEKRLSQFMEARPEISTAQARRGLARWHQGKLAEAESDLSKALERGRLTNAIREAAERALVEVRAGRTPPKKSDAKKSDFARIDEDWSIVAMMEEKEDWAGLERFYTRLINHYPRETAFAYASRGFARLSQGLVKEARADFVEALKRPDLDEQNRKVVQETLASIEAGQRDATEWEKTRTTVARLEARGDWAGLDRFYTELLERRPDEAFALSARGFARLNLGRLDEAEADFTKVLEHKDLSRSERQLIEKTLSDIEAGRRESQKWEEIKLTEERLRAKHEWAKLDELYTGILKEHPDDAYALSSRGFARLNLGRHQEARIDLTTALAHKNLDLHTREIIEVILDRVESNLRQAEEWDAIQANVARLEEQKDWEGLERFYTSFLERKPDSVFAWANRGFARLSQGRSIEAEADFNEALKHKPDTQSRLGIEAGLAKVRELKAAGITKGWYVPPANDIFESGKPVVKDNQATPVQEAPVNLPAPDRSRNKEPGKTRIKYTPKSENGRPVDVWQSFALMQRDLQNREYDKVAGRLKRLKKMRLQGEEKGMAAFYQAEVLWAGEEYEQAYEYYRQAADLIKERFRRSDALWKMADYKRRLGNREAAAGYALKSAALLPDQHWRLAQAGYLFASVSMDREAVDHFEKSLAIQEPEDAEIDLYMSLARAHMRLDDQDSYRHYTRVYIDRATGKVQGQAVKVKQDVEDLFDARRSHSYLERTFGMDSYVFGSRYANDDYSIQMVNEIFGQFKLGNMIARPYVQANGSLSSRYSGTYYEPWTASRAKWQGNSHLNDSFYAVTGFRLYPVPEYGLSLAVEQVFKIGDDTQNDTRVRFGHFWNTGLDLEPYETNWAYSLVFSEAIYSTRENDLTAFGELRGGRSFRFDAVSDTFVISPYIGAVWGYGGEGVAKGARWSLEAGPGISLRKWYNQDKYNAPMSTFDIAIQYRWGLSHDRENLWAVTLTNSF